MEMTTEELRQLSEVGMTEIAPENIATFREAEAYAKDVPGNVLARFKEHDHNPYFRKDGEGGIVRIRFANNGIRLSDIVAGMLTDG